MLAACQEYEKQMLKTMCSYPAYSSKKKRSTYQDDCVYVYCCHGNRALSVYALVSRKVGVGPRVAMVTGHQLVAAALHPFPEPVEENP